MIQYETPSPRDSDEDRYAPAPALCEACGDRPGETAVDGAWLCSVCDAALEITDALSSGDAT
jgi:hypothetical protein